MRRATSPDWTGYAVGDMYEGDPTTRWFGEFTSGARAAVQLFGRWMYGPTLGGLFLDMYDAAVKSNPVLTPVPYDVA